MVLWAKNWDGRAGVATARQDTARQDTARWDAAR